MSGHFRGFLRQISHQTTHISVISMVKTQYMRRGSIHHINMPTGVKLYHFNSISNETNSKRVTLEPFLLKSSNFLPQPRFYFLTSPSSRAPRGTPKRGTTLKIWPSINKDTEIGSFWWAKCGHFKISRKPLFLGQFRRLKHQFHLLFRPLLNDLARISNRGSVKKAIFAGAHRCPKVIFSERSH